MSNKITDSLRESLLPTNPSALSKDGSRTSPTTVTGNIEGTSIKQVPTGKTKEQEQHSQFSLSNVTSAVRSVTSAVHSVASALTPSPSQHEAEIERKLRQASLKEPLLPKSQED